MKLRPSKLKDIKWTGPELTHCSVLAGNPKIADSFTEWDWDKNSETSTSPLNHMLLKCFQLGFNRCAEQMGPTIDRLLDRVPMRDVDKDAATRQQ